MPKRESIARSWFPPTDSNTDCLGVQGNVISGMTAIHLVDAYRTASSKSGNMARSAATFGSTGYSRGLSGIGGVCVDGTLV